jgi:arsenate reductase-like glutaredoxin family protein
MNVTRTRIRASVAGMVRAMELLRMTPDELAGRLLADQRLLKLPLVRIGNGFAAGRDEQAWRKLLRPA